MTVRDLVKLLTAPVVNQELEIHVRSLEGPACPVLGVELSMVVGCEIDIIVRALDKGGDDRE